MGTRLELQTRLSSLSEDAKVYFQPGSNVRMSYPAIVYSVDGLETRYADNSAYKQDVEYQVVVISRDPDDDLWRKVGALPLCSLNRSDVVENLYHYYFTLYF